MIVTDKSNASTKLNYLRAILFTRETRGAIRSGSLNLRPYILIACFVTALDIAESKGLIFHPLRQLFIVYKGEIEVVYSTNEKPLPGKVDEIRESYLRLSQFFEIVPKISRDSDRVFLEEYIESVLTTTETLGQHISVGDKEKDRLHGLDFETPKKEMKSILGQTETR